MPLLLIPLIIGAMLFGAFRLYADVADRFGAWAGASAILSALAIVAGLVAHTIRHHRRYHGKTVGGLRVLELQGDWGRLTLDAGGSSAGYRWTARRRASSSPISRGSRARGPGRGTD
ncbi:hypothetical protein CDEN61S_03262 [Castellaniella denitrificans]